MLAINQITGRLLTTLLLAGTAHAAVIEVDVLDDYPGGSVCTLRSALDASALDRRVDDCPPGDPGIDTIRFRPGLSGTLVLNGNLKVRGPVNIEGPGRDSITIDGHVMDIAPGGGAEFTLSGLELRTGLSVGPTRGVRIHATRFDGINARMSLASAIQVLGPTLDFINISDTEFLHNQGGLAPVTLAEQARVNVVSLGNVYFMYNHGSDAGGLAVYSSYPSLMTIRDGFYAANQGYGLAGAVLIRGGASLEMFQTHFHVNRAGRAGAIHFAGRRLHVENGVFFRNAAPTAGAIEMPDANILDGDSQILFSTFVDNHDQYRGANLVVQGEPVFLKGNLMRQPYGLDNCDGGGFQSLGFNLELDNGSCPLHNYGDRDWHWMDLFLLRTPVAGYHVPVPVPVPDPYDPSAVDSIPASECRDLLGVPVIEDIRRATRPAGYHGGANPSADCDVGSVELDHTDRLHYYHAP